MSWDRAVAAWTTLSQGDSGEHGGPWEPFPQPRLREVRQVSRDWCTTPLGKRRSNLMAERSPESEGAEIRARLAELERERAALEGRLVQIGRAPRVSEPEPTFSSATVTSTSKPAEKLALFSRLFAGRHDVFPLRWENNKTGKSGYAPACANEWVRGVCNKPQIRCTDCPNQAFIPVSDEVIAKHLRGADRAKTTVRDFVAGVYPLLPNESCWFLAADFDGESWAADTLAYAETCRRKGVPAALERSRSGDGGHVWIFFAEPVPAREARQLGALIVTETMERRPEIGFASYDRFFPSQDTLPHEDQWSFLSALPRMSRDAVAGQIREAELNGRVLSVRMPVEDEAADQPWLLPPSRHGRLEPIGGLLPERIDLVLADDIEAVDLLQSHGIKARVDDRRDEGLPLPVSFLGTLRAEQVASFDALSAHDFGVLAATTAFGKTVVAAALIAHRACSPLVLVHRRELLVQESRA